MHKYAAWENRTLSVGLKVTVISGIYVYGWPVTRGRYENPVYSLNVIREVPV